MSIKLHIAFLITVLLIGLPANLWAEQAPDWYVDLAADSLVRDIENGNVEALDEFLTADEMGTIPKDAASRVIKRVLVYEQLGQANLDILGPTSKASRTNLSTALSQGLEKASLRQRMQRVVHGPRAKFSSILSCRPREFEFPKDHGKHFRLAEWWYFHGHMYAEDGSPFGYELVFFKVLPCIYFCHVAVTDEKGQRFQYSRTFKKPWKVKVKKNRLDVNYGPCWAKATSDDSISIHAQFDDVSFDLDMVQLKEALPIDHDGVIDMPEGIDSYYYSLTRNEHQGKLTFGGKTFKVSGQSWMDHQWGNFYCLRWRWDWFALQMKDGSEYCIYRSRNPRDVVDECGSSIRLPDGTKSYSDDAKMEVLQWWESPQTGDHYAVKWRLILPHRNESFLVEAVLIPQELPPQWFLDKLPSYWEGRCRVIREQDGAVGVAYCEQFPYNGPTFTDKK